MSIDATSQKSMTPPFRVRVLLRALTLAVTAFFFLPVASLGRCIPLTAGPELWPSAQHALEDALRTDGKTELQVVRPARVERISVLSCSMTHAGIPVVDCRDASSSAFVTVSAAPPIVPRIRRILRMESDDPPRV